MERCKWKNLENSQIYKEYHDKEWGEPSYKDAHLFEMLVLESFHCGLSWLLVLKKREKFRKAFDNFDAEKIAKYEERKIFELQKNTDIIRNKRKILSTIENAKTYLEIVKEYGTFSKYIWGFTNNKTIYKTTEGIITKNDLSDEVSKDFKERGFKFMGSVTIYSYLEAIGVMNNHSTNCFKHKENKRLEK